MKSGTISQVSEDKYSIPESLIQELTNGNVVAFIGAGLSIGAGLPTWNELIQYICESAGIQHYEKDPLKAAQYLEIKYGRNYIIQQLREIIKSVNIKPTENHFMLAKLPISCFITTNYDNLLERTFDTIGKPYHRIIYDNGIAYWDEKKEIQLLKMHGSIDDEERIILSENDYLQYFENHKAITLKIKDLLMYRTFMFLGYSLSDPDFNLIYSEIAALMERDHRYSYLIDFNVSEKRKIEKERKGIVFIDLNGTENNRYNSNVQNHPNKNYFLSKRLNVFLKNLNTVCQNSKSVYYPQKLKSDEEIRVSLLLEDLIGDLEQDIELPNYVELKCNSQNDEHHEVYLQNQINEWLTQEDNNLFVLLGDYGTGKTMFCRKIAFNLAKKYFQNPINHKIPLLIYLREYTKVSGIELLLENSLKKYNISFNEFSRMASAGKFLIILDGFDEMSLQLRKQISFENIIELSKLFNKKCKIIITSRTHYFKRRLDEENIFSVKDTNFTGIRLKEQKVPVSINYIQYFSSNDVDTYLAYKFRNSWAFYAQKINQIYDLHDLAKRPILLNLISQTLPNLSDYAGEIQQSKLYTIYIDLWLSREEWRGIEKNDVLQFMENLAFRMFELSEYSLSFEKLEQSVKGHFSQKILSHIDLEDFDGKIRTCSFLNRDADGNYSFMHRSFVDYFVAQYYSRQIINRVKDHFGKTKISPEISQFVSYLTSPDDRKILFDWIDFTSTTLFVNKDYLGTNSITILGAAKDSLIGKDFSGAFLPESFLVDVDLSDSFFDLALFDDSTFDSSNMTNTSFCGASVRNSSLTRAVLTNSILRADFSQSNLSEAILSEADLRNGYFYLVNFERANLWGARLNNSFLCYAMLLDTILDHANLQGCNLTNAKLLGSSFKYANIININIELDDFSDCEFDNFADCDFDGTLIEPEVCLEDEYNENSSCNCEDDYWVNPFEDIYDEDDFQDMIEEDLVDIPQDSEIESYRNMLQNYSSEEFIEKDEQYLEIQETSNWLKNIALELFWEWENSLYDSIETEEDLDDFDDLEYLFYDISDSKADIESDMEIIEKYGRYLYPIEGDDENSKDEFETFHSWTPPREYKPRIKKFKNLK